MREVRGKYPEHPRTPAVRCPRPYARVSLHWSATALGGQRRPARDNNASPIISQEAEESCHRSLVLDSHGSTGFTSSHGIAVHTVEDVR